MNQTFNNQNPKTKLDSAILLARQGDFSGLQIMLANLTSDDSEVRLKAAYCCEQVGFSTAIEPLSHMVVDDPESEVRNQAIFALVRIGRPSVVMPLIAALNDEERREDAQTALYRILGEDVLAMLTDEPGEMESNRIAAWWKIQSSRFNPTSAYMMGELASPAILIRQLKVTKTEIPDAILNPLHDSTGQDFGYAPLSKVISQWEEWWLENEKNYEAGRCYFYGYLVP